MSRRKRSSAQGADRREDWLRREQPARSRPWAYEELLFGSARNPKPSNALSSLAADLAEERAELSRMQAELHEQVARIAGFEGRLRSLTTSATSSSPARGDAPKLDPSTPTPPSARLSSPASLERGYLLARCEGFQVESPAGKVGLVEGVRFVSRIDRPDLLEVRAGRHHLMLIPIEEIEEIDLEEERLVVRNRPRLQGDQPNELAIRLRRALSFVHSAW
jgi:hypothetical protein